MSDVLVSVFARTDIGMHRSGNEDSFLVADLTTGNIGLGPDMSTHSVGEKGSLMIVSDGMGGAAAGEIASEMAVTTMRESLDEMPSSLEISERLKSAAEIANERIWNHSQHNAEYSGMGATLTAVLVQGAIAYIGQVGDSRAYLVRRDQIKQLTKDQSLAQMLVDSGAIKPDQMDTVPQNVIMQALGTQPVVKVAMTAVQLCRNDCLVICSDGLSNKVPPDELRGIVNEIQDPTDACRVLVEKANERGGEDNITVIIARFDGEALYSASEGKSITGSFRALNQGYSSEHFSSSPEAFAPQDDDPSASEEGRQQITSLLRVPALAQVEATGASPSPAALDDDFYTRITEERPAPAGDANTGAAPQTARADEQPESVVAARKKPGYATILIIALISLLLLGATGYFIYAVYLKARPVPAAAEPPPEG